MVTNKFRANMPLMRHYDKVVVVVALIVLLISLAWLITAGGSQKESLKRYMDDVEALKPTKSDLAAIDMELYNKALTSVLNPMKLVEGDERKPSFLLPERRLFCVNSACKKPVSADAPHCWACGQKQPKIGEPGDDDVKDGVSVKWLRDMGLPPDTDVAADMDEDGFTVLEEYKFKTNPKDKSSHPPFAEKLVLKEIKSVRLPLVFSGINIMPDKAKLLAFNWTGKLPRTYWVRENEAIGDTGYTAGTVTVKSEKRDNPLTPGKTKRVDTSTVVIKRKADGKEIILQVNETEKNTDVEATLDFVIDELELKLVENQEFKLREETYRVLSIDMANNTVKVENTISGKQKVVKKLD